MASLAMIGLIGSSRPLPLQITTVVHETVVSSDSSSASALSLEGQRPNPVDFTPEELQELQRRFGVHGPQPELAQLLTRGLDQLTPLRAHTFQRLEHLQPIILRESKQQGVNPMLVAAVLFDELQRAKPGEDLPIAAQSGLFKTHGPAQLSVGELVHQGLLRPDASEAEMVAAREKLLDPESNVALLVGKFARLSTDLGFPTDNLLEASASPRDAKALATLAYLHNGKLDYPARILSYMQDPALHALIYSTYRPTIWPVI
ncbi:helicase DnaB [Synechococcus sp. CS-603]|uniref:helicase DnaB n=1 Tax=Synechococcus sp. CS-603 TaxID=2847981 RepID=UPI00223B02C8|nr:helicase DnaB [Synechococcus sp. CS-603]